MDNEIRSFFAPVDDDAITTLCLNEEKRWNSRTEAKEYFHKQYMTKPIDEREPFGNVLIWILLGKDYCTDKC